MNYIININPAFKRINANGIEDYAINYYDWLNEYLPTSLNKLNKLLAKKGMPVVTDEMLEQVDYDNSDITPNEITDNKQLNVPPSGNSSTHICKQNNDRHLRIMEISELLTKVNHNISPYSVFTQDEIQKLKNKLFELIEIE